MNLCWFQDGRLRAGDKLVEISGRDMSDMTYKEVVAMLRALNDDDNTTVDLKVERKVQNWTNNYNHAHFN